MIIDCLSTKLRNQGCQLDVDLVDLAYLVTQASQAGKPGQPCPVSQTKQEPIQVSANDTGSLGILDSPSVNQTKTAKETT